MNCPAESHIDKQGLRTLKSGKSGVPVEWRGPIVSKCPRRGKAWCAGRKQSIRTLERPGVLAEHPYVVEEKDQLAVCVVLHAWWPDLISCCCEALIEPHVSLVCVRVGLSSISIQKVLWFLSWAEGVTGNHRFCDDSRSVMSGCGYSA